jgi:hypothetical protein
MSRVGHQVALYSTTLTPEIRRISGRFGSQQVVSSGRTLNFSHTSVTASVTASVTNGHEVIGNGSAAPQENPRVSKK